MTKILERINRTEFVPENSDIKFDYSQEEINDWLKSGSRDRTKENIWYKYHVLEPGFHNTYNSEGRTWKSGRLIEVMSSLPETPERIAIQKHYVTGKLALELEEGRWHFASNTIESRCFPMRIFSNLGVFLPEATGEEAYKMEKQVEKVAQVALTMAGFLHFEDFAYINDELQEDIRQMTDTKEKSLAFFKLVGLMARDLASPEEERVLVHTRKRITNTFTLEGLVICEFPELWMEGNNCYRKHNEIIKNIKEIVTEAEIWAGKDKQIAENIADSSIVDKFKSFDR